MCEALAAAKLKTLNLSDNALGEKGVRACAAAITSQVPGSNWSRGFCSSAVTASLEQQLLA